MAEPEFTIYARGLSMTGTMESLEWVLCELPNGDGCTEDLWRDLRRVQAEADIEPD